jgi:hypothetical protein
MSDGELLEEARASDEYAISHCRLVIQANALKETPSGQSAQWLRSHARAVLKAARGV